VGRDLEPAASVVTLLGRIGPPLVVAVIALVAARSAMLPGLAYWDTGELQAVGPLMGTAHPAGFPTYALLGWLASVVLQPFGDPAFRMNLFAGLCLAAAAGITVDLGRALTGSMLLGVLAGIGLALTPVAWSIGTHAEAHALHLAFVALLLRLLVAWEARAVQRDAGSLPSGRGEPSARGSRFLVIAAIMFGLSVGNHSLTLLLALPVVVFVRLVYPGVWQDRRLVALCIGAFIASVVLIYLELPLRAGPFRAPLVYGRPETWDGFWYVVLGEQFRANVIDPFGDLPGKFGALVDRTVVQFGVLAPLLPVAFAATVARQPRYAALTGLAVGITSFFAASYQNADIGRYYLGPVLMAWTWLAILGATAVDAATMALDRLAGPPGGHPSRPRRTPRSAVTVAAVVILLVPTALAIPSRFETVDAQNDRAAELWVDRALRAMDEGAVIVSWWSYSTPLWYAQHVEGRRPDLVIIDDRTRLDEGLGDITDVIDTHLGRNPVYVIRDDPLEVALLAERYELVPIDGRDAHSLTQVVGRRASGS
jgi:hypothetical protein